MKNPLFDIDFLVKLTNHYQREIFARATLLTNDELPIEYIEGRVTGGTINIDGKSALRRTCNLTMILKNQPEINNFYWTFKQKFKLEIGLKNTIDLNYPEIIWFKQGIFIITTFNMSQSVNNYTITINGKDKMCLLNGDLAGSLPHSVDFGIEEYYDEKTDTIIYTKVPLKTIIKEAVQNYGNELATNIIINDLDETALELLEYRNEDTPLYLFRNVTDGQVEQITLNENMIVYEAQTNKPIQVNQIPIYANTSNLINPDIEPTGIIYTKDDTQLKQVMKFEYGDLAGYRLTDLTYAGDLIANIGETLTSILDKIKNMLGEYEYFYNIDGKFIFQKKKIYITTPWNMVEQDENNYLDTYLNDDLSLISLTDAKLITSFGNNPNLLNLRNDFVVWGNYKTVNGTEIPIHMHYAVDTKPTYYKPIRSVKTIMNNELIFEEKGCNIYDTEEVISIDKAGNTTINYYFKHPFTTDKWDWRELIYQMALDYYKHCHDDDFLLNVASANPDYYPTGRTGYEQYYIDIQGFWRELYNPNPDPIFKECSSLDAEMLENDQDLFVKDFHRLLTTEEKNEILQYFNKSKNSLLFSPEEIYIVQEITIKNASGQNEKRKTFYPFIGSPYCCLKNGVTYYYSDGKTFKSSSDHNILNKKSLKVLYENTVSNEKELVINLRYENILKKDVELYVKEKGIKEFKNLTLVCQEIYQGGKDNSGYLQYFYNWDIIDNYGTFSSELETSYKIDYVLKQDFGNYESNYWNKSVKENPNLLTFWFDFLETEGSDLYKYSVKEIGSRTKSINDSNVKSIYYRDVPTTIFTTKFTEEYDKSSGYTYIQLPVRYETLFSISDKGKSAKERIDELLYVHSYCVENINIAAVPLYHLEPNARVIIRDDKSNINGEYIVNKITIPLTYNGTMNLTANKIISNVI